MVLENKATCATLSLNQKLAKFDAFDHEFASNEELNTFKTSYPSMIVEECARAMGRTWYVIAKTRTAYEQHEHRR